MDKQADRARRYLAERADLLGAIRLPQTAFDASSGTKVVTDVLFLRKRLAGETPASLAWSEVRSVETPDGVVTVNEYFAAHPHMVLGQERISGNRDEQGRRISGPIGDFRVQTRKLRRGRPRGGNLGAHPQEPAPLPRRLRRGHRHPSGRRSRPVTPTWRTPWARARRSR
jgi:hypothetical protein